MTCVIIYNKTIGYISVALYSSSNIKKHMHCLLEINKLDGHLPRSAVNDRRNCHTQ